ncbi:MAG: dTDP-4-dehydrorhamnose reductase [Desulfobacterales bacterium]
MKALVIGTRGQLGWELIRQGEHVDIEIVGVDLPQLDITDPVAVETSLTTHHPHLVINAAAYTNVDGAQAEKDHAFAANSQGPRNIAAACASINASLIQISTDFVFDGSKGSAYRESDVVAPVSVYGKSKAAGEDQVRSHLAEHIILRTSWLYGVHGDNFVKTMLDLGEKNTTLRVVADQYGSPTTAADLAAVIFTLAARIQSEASISWGTYHYSGAGVTTWYRFSETIFKMAAQYHSFKVKGVEPITTEAFAAAAPRPPYSALDCSLIEKTFGIKSRPWQEGLAETIDRIYA